MITTRRGREGDEPRNRKPCLDLRDYFVAAVAGEGSVWSEFRVRNRNWVVTGDDGGERKQARQERNGSRRGMDGVWFFPFQTGRYFHKNYVVCIYIRLLLSLSFRFCFFSDGHASIPRGLIARCEKF